MNLGRGHSHLSFSPFTVTKRVANAWEPLYMRRFPDVFVEVQDIKYLSFTMRRLREPDYADVSVLLEAARSLKTLWNTPWSGSKKEWRELLRTHLIHINVISDAQVDALIAKLPDVKYPVLIHGDPTLANLLQGIASNEYYWIDPLLRSYIPGDPHVDLGKMFQSCMGYEAILLGREPVSHDTFMHDLADRFDLDHDLGLTWCAVHFVRLIPYQLPLDKPTFSTLLQSLLTRVL
jgi:hypothetical protein